ncbi:pyrimidine-specific ribonucleoside hydrolase RihA-like [Halichondria panicea]|uniref:pyrimidine-specific ribonucleoside hydrolase RihA-like n=1 Tax=Halichondria panicea TaxID=6063 RepID=UPI00312B9F4B
MIMKGSRSAVMILLIAEVFQCQFCLTQSQASKRPVIIDTDIGSFIDDSFAIVYAAQSEELDIKLIVTCTQDTTARAKVIAKLMKLLGRDDVPIGIGIKNSNNTHQSLIGWGAEEDLSTYKGGVFPDGVSKMAEVIKSSGEIVEIIAIGPMTNFPSLIQRYPEVVPRARIKAMAGSIYIGYNGSKPPSVEYNIFMCPWCMQVLLAANWNKITLTPLDTCWNVALDGGQIKQMLLGDSKAATALASTLTYFCLVENCNLKDETPILFDVTGTLISMPEVGMQYMNYTTLNLTVNSAGYTVIDDTKGKEIFVYVTWKQSGERQFTDMIAKLYSTSVDL